MKRIILLAITSVMSMHVFAMERELMSYSEKPFIVSPEVLSYLNSSGSSPYVTREELQLVTDILPDIAGEAEDELTHNGLMVQEDFYREAVYMCYLKHDSDFKLGSRTRKFQRLYNLREHERNVHNIKTYACMKLVRDGFNTEPYLCKQVFFTNNDRNIHQAEHRFVCHRCYANGEQCGSFELGSLNTHIIREHGRDQVYSCLLCNPYTPFSIESALYTHLKEEHNLLNG